MFVVDVVLAARNIDEPEDMSRIEHYAGQRGNRVWLYCGLITAGRMGDPVVAVAGFSVVITGVPGRSMD